MNIKRSFSRLKHVEFVHSRMKHWFVEETRYSWMGQRHRWSQKKFSSGKVEDARNDLRMIRLSPSWNLTLINDRRNKLTDKNLFFCLFHKAFWSAGLFKGNPNLASTDLYLLGIFETASCILLYRSLLPRLECAVFLDFYHFQHAFRASCSCLPCGALCSHANLSIHRDRLDHHL